ncbi:methyltransferase [Salinirubellus salinus]|uniref:Methyltransferase n=1 Tax=Salinirubellus salinus TaxID=1364945 RepID=A0A9E7UAS7_9EURY|nr:methyltransferase [Salinirubellus salinus]UWM54362.1 methyltransferase [Salinirubellus salinus]
MDETTLVDWVKQPPANPTVQYLRDAERRATRQCLAGLTGRDAHLLDVASEVNVTADVQAERITRLDFSRDASARAEEILGDSVDEYVVTDPTAPVLEFDSGRFDGGLSVGPYDWLFLDIETLTDELHRVCAGPVVLTVPTTRSPYYPMDGGRMRYYEPDEVLDLVSPDWWLHDRTLIYQFPHRVHRYLTRLPTDIQETAASLAARRTEQITDRGRWECASQVVLSVRPLPYRSYLSDALEALFRPTAENGFWDEGGRKIARGLGYRFDDDGSPIWRVDNELQWRYAPFALVGALRWRTSGLGTTTYDEKLRRELEYFRDRVEDGTIRAEMPSYGVGPLVASFSLAATAFDEEVYVRTARELFEHSQATYQFEHAEDSLLLFGWAHLYEQTGDDEVRGALADGLWTVNKRLNDDDLFEFDNHTTLRHQNQMYTLWGVCRAAGALGADGYLATAERVLDYTIRERLLESGAFVWEDLPVRVRLRHDIEKRLGRRPPHWDFLYSCHQTFFVNAVGEYYRAGGDRRYSDVVRRAMEWIYGANVLGENLHTKSDIGVPMRFLTVDGRMDVSDQMFKGAYEVGSYLMALTNLLDGPFDCAPDDSQKARAVADQRRTSASQ